MSDANKLARGRSAKASVPALPGAYVLRAARGRNVSISVPAADCALPSEMKSRRGRTAKVPAVDCALPGVEKSSSARGRVIVPDVAVVLQVPDTQLGFHKICATPECKVPVDVDNISAPQPSIDVIPPLTGRRHKCEYCASMGRCKKHCFTKRRRLRDVATTKSSGGSREPVDA